MLCVLLAAKKGIQGNLIFLNDGTLVDDDECVGYFAQNNEVFFIENSINPLLIVKNVEIEIIDQLIDNNDDGVVIDSSDDEEGVQMVDEIIDDISDKNVDNFDDNPDDENKEDPRVNLNTQETLDVLNSVANFPINFSSFSMKVQNKINQKNRLKNSEKSEIIQKTVETMQKLYGSNPSNFIISAVALKLHTTYPILNQIDDEGNVIGQGNFTTIKQITGRLYYLNSQYNTKSKENTTKRPNSKSGTSRKNKKAGCLNYKPKKSLTGKEVSQIKNWLQIEFKKVPLHRDIPKLEKYLLDTYAEQRDFLLQMPLPTIDTLISEWPLLFEFKYLTQHFKTLCGLEHTTGDIKSRFIKIYKSLKTEPFVATTDNELVKNTLDELNKYFKIKNKEDFYILIEVKLIYNFKIYIFSCSFFLFKITLYFIINKYVFF